MSADELVRQLYATHRPHVLSLVTNNVCNLNCRHCYLQVDALPSTLLSEDEWLRTLESVQDLGPELLCFAGKELFATPTGPRLLTAAARLRERAEHSFRLGLITNGTLIARHRERLLDADLSYLDISLDGTAEEHDAVRGEGAFDRAWPNVVWAAQSMGDRFFINLTLQHRNAAGWVKALELYRGLGVRNVELGFYIPLPYTTEALSLTGEDITTIFASLRRLRELPAGPPIRVLMDLDLTTPAPLARFLESEWFDFDELVEDTRGEVFIPHDFGNGVTLEVRLAPYPVGVTRSLRIGAEGEYLAAEETIDTRLYRSRQIGSVREAGYDLAALHRQALGSGRVEALVKKFFLSTLPHLVRAATARDRLSRAA